jgi:hypothetical protein
MLRFVGLWLLVAALPALGADEPYSWWSAGQGDALPASASYADPNGAIGILNVSGAVDTRSHPFFQVLGANGRACVTCHQPANGMSISAAALRERWQATQGKDPVFAGIDGSNCPSLPPQLESSHSLLLERGLFRIFLPWPRRDRQGHELASEFTIEVVSDPAGCNRDPQYGLHSKDPHISVYRRPRPVANLKYPLTVSGPMILKSGTPADIDPETGQPVNMNIMADAREPTLKTQAMSAARDHLQVQGSLSDTQLKQLVDFETQIYTAQARDTAGGDLTATGGPQALGPHAMAEGKVRVLGDSYDTPVFKFFDSWATAQANDAASSFRASVARGNDIYMYRPFWIRDATHINSIGLGNPIKRTCATCHNTQMTGQDLIQGFVDLGTTTYPLWTESPLSNEQKLPVFKVTCDAQAKPHPYLGRVIYTTDPGRALISGKCVDVGSIVMQQLRGLAARAPYFANGSAQTLRELVDYYDRRFDIKYTEQEKVDLVNFLSVL